jgi:hypothetical protein
MSSILKVDEIQDTSGNNIINESSDTITIGASGDTVNVVGTLQNNGSAISVASLSTASGSAPSYSARAWVNFNGTGTVAIRASGNVSSITDNDTGSYTVNFTTSMEDTNYAVVINAATTYSSANQQWQLISAYQADAIGSTNIDGKLVDNDNSTFVSHDIASVMIGVFR